MFTPPIIQPDAAASKQAASDYYVCCVRPHLINSVFTNDKLSYQMCHSAAPRNSRTLQAIIQNINKKIEKFNYRDLVKTIQLQLLNIFHRCCPCPCPVCDWPYLVG